MLTRSLGKEQEALQQVLGSGGYGDIRNLSADDPKRREIINKVNKIAYGTESPGFGGGGGGVPSSASDIQMAYGESAKSYQKKYGEGMGATEFGEQFRRGLEETPRMEALRGKEAELAGQTSSLQYLPEFADVEDPNQRLALASQMAGSKVSALETIRGQREARQANVADILGKAVASYQEKKDADEAYMNMLQSQYQMASGREQEAEGKRRWEQEFALSQYSAHKPRGGGGGDSKADKAAKDLEEQFYKDMESYGPYLEGYGSSESAYMKREELRDILIQRYPDVDPLFVQDEVYFMYPDLPQGGATAGTPGLGTRRQPFV